jgi:uncharacterized protein
VTRRERRVDKDGPVSIFSGLIELQAHDSALSQLHHRRGHLPEHTETSALHDTITRLTTESAASRDVHRSLSERMAKIESAVHELDAKISGVEATMFSGTITSPRELQGFEADIASLKKRRSELEDDELALIEEAEPLDAMLAEFDAKHAHAQSEIERLSLAIIAAQAEIDVDAARHVAERSALVATLDPPTVALYEATRAKNRGIGAAVLEHGTCMSCKITLPAIELDRIRHLPPDEMVRCEECSVIIVR